MTSFLQRLPLYISSAGDVYRVSSHVGLNGSGGRRILALIRCAHTVGWRRTERGQRGELANGHSGAHSKWVPRIQIESKVRAGRCAYCHADARDLSRITYEHETYLCPDCVQQVITRAMDPELQQLVTRHEPEPGMADATGSADSAGSDVRDPSYARSRGPTARRAGRR